MSWITYTSMILLWRIV